MDLRKYLITTSLLTILTAVLGLFALNRLWGVFNEGKLFFDFTFRNSLEHLLVGFYIPLIFTFIVLIMLQFSNIFFRKVDIFNESWVLWSLFSFSILYFILEFYFQFFRSFNDGSIVQIIMSFIGIVLCWVYVAKLKTM